MISGRRASGVRTYSGATAVAGKAAHIIASPNRNFLQINNDNEGNILIVIGCKPEELGQWIADGRYFKLYGSTAGNRLPGAPTWQPTIIPTDDIYVVPEVPVLGTVASAITDSAMEIIDYVVV